MEEMKQVATLINESIAAAENLEKCTNIQKLFGGSIKIMVPGRKFIKEGSLLKQCRKERKMRRFFLFSDILLYGFDDVIPGRVNFSMKLELLTTLVEDLPDNSSENIENVILIQTTGKSFYIFAKNLEEKKRVVDSDEDNHS
eukprot:TRINITY_DN4973_c0_g1_i9.p1 TRINITY_DN4973_c0_g1~~TRINITY_DN4973_c0_g1_i9.p1  ORF type:complete len:142 (-),score=43.90 TRINITY_DN4973_c0_g1_i9:517-942(-)